MELYTTSRSRSDFRPNTKRQNCQWSIWTAVSFPNEPSFDLGSLWQYIKHLVGATLVVTAFKLRDHGSDKTWNLNWSCKLARFCYVRRRVVSLPITR